MHKNKILLLTTLFAALIGLLISSCEITDPTEGLEVRLNTFSRETLASAYIYDANTLQPVDGNVQVTFTGSNSEKIVDETNEHKTQFIAEDGIFIFGVEDGAEFSPSLPFRVNVILQANNYYTESATVKLTKKGIHTVNLFMVNPSNLPDDSDTDSFSAGQADNSGSVSQDVQHTSGKGTSVSISSGTVITTENGNPLVGSLTSNITVIPLTSQNRYNAPQDITTSNNENVDAVMKFNFSITDQSGNTADNFSNNVSFSLPIPDGFEIPNNTETITVWKKNNTTGFYEEVGQADIVIPLSTGKNDNITAGSLNGNTKAGGELLLGSSNETCSANVTIDNLPNGFNSTIQIFNAGGNLITTTNNSTLDLDINSAGITVASVRINSDLNDPFNTGVELGSGINLSCGSNSITLNFPSDLVGISFDIVGVCTARDPVVIVNPNVSFSYKKVGASTWQSGNLINGKATITGLEVGATYDVSATYRGNTANTQVELVDPTTINILDVADEAKLLSSNVNSSTSPPTLEMEIDIEDECD